MPQELQLEISETMTAWCMPCRAHKTVQNPKPKYIRGAKGTRLQLQGKCPDCGGVVNRFLKSKGKVPPSSLPEPEQPMAKEPPKRAPRRSKTPLHVVTYYLGTCQRCRVARRFTGQPIGTRYDGMKVIQGRCLTCQQPQVVVGVREDETEEDDG